MTTDDAINDDAISKEQLEIAEKEVERLMNELDTPEWHEAFKSLGND